MPQNSPDLPEVMKGRCNLQQVKVRLGQITQLRQTHRRRQDVAFGPANIGLTGDELEERVSSALEAVGMEEFVDRAPHHLSFGQRRRVAVATVLAMRPEILVLDEPSSNLDPAGRRELADILRSLDITMLMVTHDLPYALELCPRALVMNHGSIVGDGPTVDVLSDEDLMRANRLELPFGFYPAEAMRSRGVV